MSWVSLDFLSFRLRHLRTKGSNRMERNSATTSTRGAYVRARSWPLDDRQSVITSHRTGIPTVKKMIAIHAAMVWRRA